MTVKKIQIFLTVLSIAASSFCGCAKPESKVVAGKISSNAGKYNSIDVNGNTVYVSYYDSENMDLMLARSMDSGLTWKESDIRKVDSKGNVGHDSCIAVDGNNVYISYYDSTSRNLKFARSVDGGLTWKPEHIITVDTDKGAGMFSSVALSGKYIYLSYSNKKARQLKFAVSADRGKTWKKDDIRVVDDTAVSKGGWYTSIAGQGDEVYISYNGAYHQRKMGKSLKFAKSRDRGKTWKAADIKIVEGPECSLGLYTSIALRDNNLYISYTSKKGLKLAFSGDRGDTWKPEDIIIIDRAEKREHFGYTSIAINNGTIYISYVRADTLRFAKSDDCGLTWSRNNIQTLDTIVKKNRKGRFERGQTTSIATSGSNVFISYYDGLKEALRIARSKDNGQKWNR